MARSILVNFRDFSRFSEECCVRVPLFERVTFRPSVHWTIDVFVTLTRLTAKKALKSKKTKKTKGTTFVFFTFPQKTKSTTFVFFTFRWIWTEKSRFAKSFRFDSASLADSPAAPYPTSSLYCTP